MAFNSNLIMALKYSLLPSFECLQVNVYTFLFPLSHISINMCNWFSWSAHYVVGVQSTLI